ncbi:MAG: DNA repair protein RecN [Actinobacteria bacterium]|uniref:DNA repair protein RecN n=1 Tax=freshwater metagenome TaxID=449393 RepID=A0A6J5YFU4_9ZZZZ|nr:DNA repair protein RecN [Actinomycetota bacterium]MTA77638.1 DNA repair protein RecN [Actinomycetota bacterium]
MLTELQVRDLGVIADLRLDVGAGMTAVTGETGAGKTLVVTAISLLMGGRSDTSMVRPGATEAVVEARFEVDGSEHILRRVIPASGRSRAYVDGRLATLSELSEIGAGLVDIHGQHDHQSLLTASVQRHALDQFAGIDLEPLRAARRALADIEARQAQLGGDARDRARELDLLRFQVEELEQASILSPDEDDLLRAESELLADATGHREAAEHAVFILGEEGGAIDQVLTAVSALGDRVPFEQQAGRLLALRVELDDLLSELRRSAESIEADPGRLADIGERRRLLQELRRKYGDTLEEVLAWQESATMKLAALEGYEELAESLEHERGLALEALATCERVVDEARRRAAPELAGLVEAQLPDLALPNARVGIEVEGVAGSDVRFLFAANPGMPLQPLAKVASGGELARAMLGLRLVLSEGPPVLVFDEVDAGIGGAAALAVGRALAAVAAQRQVFVVTHLAQVAAWADSQVVVDKVVDGVTTATVVSTVEGAERVTELARMLSGTPESEAAQRHARELLAMAQG